MFDKETEEAIVTLLHRVSFRGNVHTKFCKHGKCCTGLSCNIRCGHVDSQ